MTREEAWELLTEYNQDEFHLLHAQTVENTMRSQESSGLRMRKISGES